MTSPPHDDDFTDIAIGAWRTLVPDVDPSPIAVTLRLRRAGALLERILDDFLSAPGLVTLGEYDLLAALRRSPSPQTPSALAERLMITRAGMTGRLDRLEERRLIRRTPDPEDGRGVLVRITPKGRSTVDRTFARLCAFQADLLASVPETTQTELAAGLKLLLGSLREHAPGR